ncbi:hypothetical protein [Halorussus sp. AFM4]|uniref:hypothetical protein n=1 Tax=Halorussus sp. AFM4 TaxID=3421651 RepID=UPI003EBC4979
MPSTYGSRSRNRPLGVTVLCLLGFVGALFSLIDSVGMLGVPGPGPVLGLLGLMLTLAKLVVLVGLWNLQRWGHTWALIFYGFAGVLALLTVDPISLVINVAVVIYLMSKGHHFR